MTGTLERLGSARELPEAWDALAGCCFQRREFLLHAEQHNPCLQRYWLLEEEGRLAAGAVVYTLPLDLLTFAKIPSPIRMQIVGLPVSVSASGLLGAPEPAARLAERLIDEEKGLVVGLNLDAPASGAGLLVGRTLPTIVLDRRFESLAQYVGSLNADYRRRFRRLRKAFSEVVAEPGPCARFGEADYRQYLNVFERSDAKLERLALPFFQHLPPWFTLTRYRLQGEQVGWHICARDGERFYFFLGGLDYARNEALHTYFNLLVGVLEEGIGAGARVVDFGQTAEVPKTRLGGAVVEKHLFAYHRSAVVRGLLRAARGVLEYTRRVPETHPFRAEAGR